MAWRGLSARRRGDDPATAYPPATDLERWSLEVDQGRQVWRYLASASTPRADRVASRYHLGLDITAAGSGSSAAAASTSAAAASAPSAAATVSTSAASAAAAALVNSPQRPKTLLEALDRGTAFFSLTQTQDGHWAGDYGGPMFLLPGYAITTYITKTPVPEPLQLEIVRYLSNMQADDGGWGIHIESQSTVFGTALNYVTMRIFGVAADDDRMVRARAWLQSRRGCLGIPSWGKFWLAVLNVYSWDGVHSLFPEMVLLPEWFPLHTRRLWSYCRTVYMPMSYIYGVKFQAPVDALVTQLRQELIFEPYDQVGC